MAVFTDQLILGSQRVVLSHWPLLPPWGSTQLAFPYYKRISLPFSFLQKYYTGWKNFRCLRQGLPHRSMWEMAPGAGVGVGKVKWKGGTSNVGCAPSGSPHLILELWRTLRSLVQCDCLSHWRLSFLRKDSRALPLPFLCAKAQDPE